MKSAAPHRASMMKGADLFVSVVVPLHNDADILEPFLSETVSVLGRHYENFEVVMVDDGSTDATGGVISDLLKTHAGLRVMKLSRHFGQEIAISAGLDSVIGDFVVVMLPDVDPPNLIPEMVERSRGGAGVVFGIRTHRANDPQWLRAGAAGFYWICNRLLGMNVPRDSTHFRVMSRQALNAILRIKDPSRYLQTLSAYVGYGSQSFPYQPLQRRRVSRLKTLSEAIRLAINIVVSNTTRPLQLVSYAGLALSSAYLLYIGYTVLVYAFKSRVAEGWTTLSAQAAVGFFFLFLMLAVLSEYIGSLLAQTRERPLYFVVEERNSVVMTADKDRRNVVDQSLLEEDVR
jgi:glycosyltransferase involved in cell wall biosynthesis